MWVITLTWVFTGLPPQITIRSDFAISRGSGPVMRPTPAVQPASHTAVQIVVLLARIAHDVAQPVDAVALHQAHRAGVVIRPDRLAAMPRGGLREGVRRRGPAPRPSRSGGTGRRLSARCAAAGGSAGRGGGPARRSARPWRRSPRRCSCSPAAPRTAPMRLPATSTSSAQVDGQSCGQTVARMSMFSPWIGGCWIMPGQAGNRAPRLIARAARVFRCGRMATTPSRSTAHRVRRRTGSASASTSPSGARIGPGKVALLEEIARSGSISAAGRALKMSYRRAWELVEDLNRASRPAGGQHRRRRRGRRRRPADRGRRHAGRRIPRRRGRRPQGGEAAPGRHRPRLRREMMHHAADDLLSDLAGLFAGETDPVANAANAAAAIWQHVERHQLGRVLFPQGRRTGARAVPGQAGLRAHPARRAACAAPPRHGGETVVVDDVHAFPGHIACDGASHSEIVVPLLRDGALLGVLDIDSPESARFGAAERALFEAVARAWSPRSGAELLGPQGACAVPPRLPGLPGRRGGSPRGRRTVAAGCAGGWAAADAGAPRGSVRPRGRRRRSAPRRRAAGAAESRGRRRNTARRRTRGSPAISGR